MGMASRTASPSTRARRRAALGATSSAQSGRAPPPRPRPNRQQRTTAGRYLPRRRPSSVRPPARHSRCRAPFERFRFRFRSALGHCLRSVSDLPVGWTLEANEQMLGPAPHRER
eukprot:1413386-Prymnesium_polylepis.2